MKDNFIFKILIIYGICGLAANMAHPITPTLFNLKGFESVLFGLSFSMMSFSNFVFSNFWPHLFDRYQAKIMVLISCFGYGFAQLGFVMADNVNMLLFSRFIAGAFISGLFVGIPFYIIQFTDDRTGIITRSATIFSVAGTLGYFLGGYLGNKNVYLPVYIQAFLYFICGFLFYLIMQDNKTEGKFYDKAGFNILNLQKNQLLILSVTFFVVLASVALSQSYSYYLINILHVNPLFNGITRGVSGFLAFMINMFITIKILKSKNKESKLKYYLLFMIIGYLCLLFNFNFDKGFIITGIFIMSFDTMHLPMLQAMCIEYYEAGNKAAIIGFQNGIKALAMILGAFLSGLIFDYFIIGPFILALMAFIMAYLISYGL